VYYASISGITVCMYTVIANSIVSANAIHEVRETLLMLSMLSFAMKIWKEIAGLPLLDAQWWSRA
jgi:hypothetical protein